MAAAGFGSSGYAATKAYIQSLGEALHLELKPFGATSEENASGTIARLGHGVMVRPGILSKLLELSLRKTFSRSLRSRILARITASMTKHQGRVLAMTLLLAGLVRVPVRAFAAFALDPAAPARAEAEIRIKAPLEVVWSVETAIDGWPKWNPGVSRAILVGPLQPGSTFDWKSGGSAISSTLQVVEPMKRVGWTGRTMGIRAVHLWTFEQSDGEIIVRTEESFSGLLVRLFPGTFRNMLADALRKNIEALKAESEKRAKR